MNKDEITGSLNRLQAYIEKENYSGYDPYDALTSPFFELPLLKKNKLLRFGIQQLVKRSPFNLRPLLKIKKGLNPVTLGLCIQGYTALGKSGAEEEKSIHQKCESLINQLETLIPAGYNGACWGYDFPWEARNANIPAYQPTIVATGIITNALFKYYQYSGNTKAFEMCQSACNFILKDLNQTVSQDGSICFSYSPFDSVQVFNASLKGARLLIQVYSITREKHLLDTAEKAIRYVINNQQTDGSWYYSTSPKGKWVDNYHTGYILDCIDVYRELSGDARWNDYLKKGYRFYSENLFENGYIPKFFNNSTYPLDCTAAAQAILTTTRFKDYSKAYAIASFTIEKMQSEIGYFYFRKYRLYTERHSFMRWSNGWMFAAIATLRDNQLYEPKK